MVIHLCENTELGIWVDGGGEDVPFHDIQQASFTYLEINIYTRSTIKISQHFSLKFFYLHYTPVKLNVT